ncbi:MAG TPA: hypothetical protein VLU38_06315 [Methanomassiliicoccales archaeon]|nr:hypothetical protein [Methanomassiliicoccales archaeon]
MAESSWTESIAKREAARDVMRNGERVGEAFAILFFYLVILFFVVNQVDDTGFFTTGFGSTEMVLFYGGLIFGMIAPILRLILGRRNKVRPVELISNGFFIIAASYLLSVFPFDFAHFPDLLPEGIQFMFDWITNDIARVGLSIIIVIVIIVSVWTAFLYIVVRDWLRAHPSTPDRTSG